MAGKSDGVIKHKIVLEGEKEYKKALTDINRAQRVTASELRANKAAYDEAEGSQEALTSRLEILTRAHDQAGEKVALLTKRLEQVSQAYGEDSAEADGMRISLNNARAAMSKLGNEAADTRRQLEQLTDSAQETQSATNDMADGLEDGVQQMDDAGDIADALAGKLAGAARDALALGSAASLAKAGLKIAADVSADAEGAMQTLAIQTGLTGDALSEMEANAAALMSTGLFSSRQEAASALATVYQNMRLTGDELEQATRDAQLLNTSFGVDIPESTRTANALMQTFGIDAKAAYDLMAYGIQNGANQNGDLMDTLREYSPMFAQMGFSADEFAGILVRGAQNGTFSVDKIGDALKEFYLRMTEGDEKTQEALASLGLESADVMQKLAAGGATGRAAFDLVIDSLAAVEDPVQRNQIAVALFGTQAEDMGYRVVELFGGVAGAAADAEGTMQAINDVKMNDLDTEINRLRNNLANGIEPVATWFRSAITGILQDANDILEGKNPQLSDQTQEERRDRLQTVVDVALTPSTSLPSLSQSASSWWQGIKKVFADSNPDMFAAQTAAQEAGAATGQGFVLGIESEMDAAGESGASLGNAMMESLRNKLGIHSPSTEGIDAGEMFDEGLVTGMDEGAPDVADSAQELARGAIEALQNELTIETGREIGLNWGEGLARGLTASQGRVSAAARRLAESIEAATRTALDTHSPSGVGMDIGMDWGAGIALGEERSMGGVREAALGIADVMARASVPSSGAATPVQIDYGALGEAVADAMERRGIGSGVMVGVFDAEAAADALTPGISSRIAQSASMTLSGRAKRL